MDNDLQQFVANFVASTREHLKVRVEDNLLILRPNRTHFLNSMATLMLDALYNQEEEEVDANVVIERIAAQYNIPPAQVANDLSKLLQSLAFALQNRTECAPAIRFTEFGTHQRHLPVLSEIALTYRCQHRCTFCYASAPQRGRKVAEMTTVQAKTILDKFVDEARVPTVSFTGGEPTLREDLPALIQHAKSRGMRVNLITNGYRSADATFVASLAQAGLDSAQVSLEASDAATHDAVVQHPGAFERTIAALKNLKAAGIHTHTNTTINSNNLQALPEMIDFLAAMGQEYLSMNMVIHTGDAVGQNEINYTAIGSIIKDLKERTEAHGMRFIWYSPVPYCLFNPIAHGLGGQSCAAADGLLSIAPDGQVLPCSSFAQGLGNLLQEDFTTIWNRRAARYWRDKEFLPPGCQTCELAAICCGACPLYWDEQGSFDEIQAHLLPTKPWAQLVWWAKRQFIGRVKGVGIK